MYRLSQLFPHDNASAVFFVSLTVVADILIGTLLIAVGNRYYRDYSTHNFRRRLAYRRQGLLALFLMNTHAQQLVGEVSEEGGERGSQEGASMDQKMMDHAVGAGVGAGVGKEVGRATDKLAAAAQRRLMSFEEWCVFCGSLPFAYRPRNAETVRQLFQMEVPEGVAVAPVAPVAGARAESGGGGGGGADVRAFFRLCALLASRTTFAAPADNDDSAAATAAATADAAEGGEAGTTSKSAALLGGELVTQPQVAPTSSRDPVKVLLIYVAVAVVAPCGCCCSLRLAATIAADS